MFALGIPGKVNAMRFDEGHQPVEELSDKQYPLYVFSKVLQWIELDQLPSVVKKMGYDGIDLTVRNGGHIEPKDAKKLLPQFVAQCKNEGMSTPILTTGILDAEGEYAHEILETASKAGIKIYRLGWYKYDIKRSIEDQIKEFTDKLKRIAELNKEYGITGNYQNHSGPYFGASIWDLNYSLKRIGVPKNELAVQFDIRHAIVEGVKSWMQDFKSIADRISSLVIKDFCWISDHSLEPQNVALGKGVIDFAMYFNLLREMKINAPVSIHLEHPLGGAEAGSREPGLSVQNLVNAIEAERKFIDEVLANKK